MIVISDLIKEARKRRTLSFPPCADIVRGCPLTDRCLALCPVLRFLASGNLYGSAAIQLTVVCC